MHSTPVSGQTEPLARAASEHTDLTRINEAVATPEFATQTATGRSCTPVRISASILRATRQLILSHPLASVTVQSHGHHHLNLRHRWG